jgi:hypothetical protein
MRLFAGYPNCLPRHGTKVQILMSAARQGRCAFGWRAVCEPREQDGTLAQLVTALFFAVASWVVSSSYGMWLHFLHHQFR